MKKAISIFLGIAVLGYISWSLAVLSGYGMLCQTEGFNTKRMELADSAIYRAMSDGEFQGAVLCVVKRAADNESMGDIVYHKAYGNRSVLSVDGDADTLPMVTNAIFDLASLSKCASTTLAIMRLTEDGKLRLTDRVDRYIKDFKPWDSIAEPKTKSWSKRRKAPKPEIVMQEAITIKHLLTHTSGLPSYVGIPQLLERYQECNPEGGLLRDSLTSYIAHEAARLSQPGTRVRYSCLNFIALQAIIEHITGCRLDEFATQAVFEPLRLKNTWYNNIDSPMSPYDESSPIVPTQVQSNGSVLYGEAHDPLARVINRGVSGNAGLFSTAEDLAVIASMLMNGGVLRYPKEGWQGKLGLTKPHRFYSQRTVDTFFQVPDMPREFSRALGWDAAYDKGGCYGDLMTPDGVASHLGYTGTSLAIDHKQGVAIILLTNRVHPYDKGSLARTRAVIANIVISAIE